MRDDTERYAGSGIVVWGINGGSAQSHDRFARRHGLNAPLLADKGLRVARLYDAVLSLGPITFVRRTVVGIDRQGQVVFYKRGIPSTDEILAAF